MRKWEYFQMFEERSENVKVFEASERAELEAIVAQQVADLLSAYGRIEPAEIDTGACPDIDEPQTFNRLELEPVVLEDDKELIIAQIPCCGDTFITQLGWHTVIVEDDDGVVEHEIVVHDPSHDAERMVHTPEGQEVEGTMLQELYEALTAVTVNHAYSNIYNVPPLNTADFPVPVSDPDFEQIVNRIDPQS